MNQEELAKQLHVRSIYRHFNGKLYTAIGMAQDAEQTVSPDSKEKVVKVILSTYEADLNKPEIILVSLTKFFEPATKDGVQVPRFTELI